MLITFPFTDLSGTKLRPVVVLINTATDVTVSFITTQLQWQEPADQLLTPSATNGIKKPSLVRTGKIATLSLQLVKGVLCYFSNSELTALNNNLKSILQLP